LAAWCYLVLAKLEQASVPSPLVERFREVVEHQRGRGSLLRIHALVRELQTMTGFLSGDEEAQLTQRLAGLRGGQTLLPEDVDSITRATRDVQALQRRVEGLRPPDE
jgi:hypothetical protein